MGKARWTSDDFKKAGLVETPNGFVKANSLTQSGKVEKITPYQLEVIKKVESREGNRKIRNAMKIEENGVVFDSKLEKYMYDLLTGAQIDFQFQKTYILQEKFRYRDEAVRAISLTVDFWLPERNMIIDTKGHQTQQGAMRWKMLKSVLRHLQDSQPEIILPATKKECDLLLNKLLYEPCG